MARLVLVCGPSGIGKSPLRRALQRAYPVLAERLQTLVLYTDRALRPGEVEARDYFFRPRAEIAQFTGDPEYIVLPVRRDLQALHLPQVTQILQSGRDAFFEGNPYIARVLLEDPRLRDCPRVSCFLSPLTAEEIVFLSSRQPDGLPALVSEIMRRKLLRRTQSQKGELTAADLVDIEARCTAAWQELHDAPLYDWVLPNHDGEDSENWAAFPYPLGDARRTLLDLAAILEGRAPRWAEHWPADLLP